MLAKQRMLLVRHAGVLFPCVLAISVLAADHGSKYKMTQPEHLQVFEKLIYNYTHSKYDPPVVIDLSKEVTGNDTPEEAAISLTSAMAAGDYSGYLRGFTAEGQKVLADMNKADHETPEYWTKLWAGAFKGRKVELRDRVDTGKYVILDMISVPLNSSSANDLGEIPWVLVADSKGHWWPTQDLAPDPVFKDWSRPNTVNAKIMR
jgi:hypothetical protein